MNVAKHMGQPGIKKFHFAPLPVGTIFFACDLEGIVAARSGDILISIQWKLNSELTLRRLTRARRYPPQEICGLPCHIVHAAIALMLLLLLLQGLLLLLKGLLLLLLHPPPVSRLLLLLQLLLVFQLPGLHLQSQFMSPISVVCQ